MRPGSAASRKCSVGSEATGLQPAVNRHWLRTGLWAGCQSRCSRTAKTLLDNATAGENYSFCRPVIAAPRHRGVRDTLIARRRGLELLVDRFHAVGHCL